MEREVEISYTLWFHKDARTWWQSLDHDKMMGISDEAFEKLILDKWSHAKVNIKRTPRVYFHMETLYYRFMDVFIKKISLFLLTLVAA
jgi:hypothetical protein